MLLAKGAVAVGWRCAVAAALMAAPPAGSANVVVVLNSGEASVSLIDQVTLEKKFDIVVPNGPDCMEVSADGKLLWVTQRWAKRVAVVDIAARRLVQTIPVGKSPHGIFFANSAPWK